MLKPMCFAVLAISTAAGAQNPASTPADKAASQAPAPATAKPDAKDSDLNRVVCEVQDKIGTRLGAHKVCLTVAQWREFRDDEKQQTDRVLQQGIVGFEPPGH